MSDGSEVPFDGERFDVTYPMAFVSYHKSNLLLVWCNEDFIKQSITFGDDVWMSKVVKYLERLTAVGILRAMGAMDEPLTKDDIDRLSPKWEIFAGMVNDQNRMIAETSRKYPDPIVGTNIRMDDFEAVMHKMMNSLAFLMVHHQSDLMKVVTENSLAGPNKECGPTSFAKVADITKDNMKEWINETFGQDTQRLLIELGDKAWPTISWLINMGFLGSAEILNDKVRRQVKPFLPDDMTDPEKEKFLKDMFPNSIGNIYEYSLGRIINKMDP